MLHSINATSNEMFTDLNCFIALKERSVFINPALVIAPVVCELTLWKIAVRYSCSELLLTPVQ